MKTRVHNRHAALRIFAGLLFVFMMANATVANASPPAAPTPDEWDGKTIAESLANAGSGDGSQASTPIEIATGAELAYLAQQVNAGGTTLKIGENTQSYTAGFSGIYFKLTSDIDLGGHDWKPIGNFDNPFSGIFDGDGHTLNGLKVEVSAGNKAVCAGLFGYVTDGTLQNLGVSLASGGIKANAITLGTVAYAGGIVGGIKQDKGTAIIRNCYVTGDGTVEATSEQSDASAGGIAGYALYVTNIISLTHCYATVGMEVTAGTYDDAFAGGIAGKIQGTISYTFATGKVAVNGGYHQTAGGICGSCTGQITNSLALNTEVTVTKDESDNCNRIGKSNSTPSANYANPDMLVIVNNQPQSVADDADGKNGTSTWLDKLKSDLTKEPKDDNGWNLAWDWTNTDALPQLKKVKVEDGGSLSYNNGNLSGQITHLLSETPLTQSPWSYNVAEKIENNGDGDGSSSPILIKDANELAYFAQQVNKGEALAVGTSTIEFSKYNKYSFALSADIDLSGRDWTPIGIDKLGNKIFQGHFDGQGHVVKGLRIKMTNVTGYVYAGLFGWARDATIQNLGVRLDKDGIEVSSTTGTVHAGGIVGYLSASSTDPIIRNCYVEAENEGAVKITGTGASYNAYAGGIAGYAQSSNFSRVITITHCYTTVNVEATANGTLSYAGGIAGSFIGTLSYTYATGKIEAKGNGTKYTGGICGNTLTVTNCLALNEAVIAEGDNCGRITGFNTKPLSSNYANPAMKVGVNGETVVDEATKADESTNGSSTCLDLFVNDLKGSSPANEGWNSGNWKWDDTPNSTQLPQLKVVTIGTDGKETYSDWQAAAPAQQPTLYASVLKNAPKLHIVQPTDGSGTLAVSEAGDPNNTPLTDDTPLRPGTRLNLSSTPKAGYDFKNFLSGSSAAAINQPATSPFAMTVDDLWLSASFSKTPEPVEPVEPVEPEPKVYHTVTLPAVEGATTDPVPGDYEIEAWDTFRFYLTLDEAYNLSTPIVTTDRGETLSPRTSDGAYLVKYVRSDVEIFIDGIEPNNPVGNEVVVSGTRVWSAEGSLHIRTAAPTPVRIYTFAGSLRRAFRSDGGEQTLTLPPGSYIVVVGEVRYKVML
ncbi:InlB B-repeat-containing protein [Parabacteroides sp.]